jgi:hypothetical protein
MERGFHHSTRSDQYIAATVAATGVAEGAIGPCPEGYCWYVERLSPHSNTANASTGLLEIFVRAINLSATDISRQARQDFYKGVDVQDSIHDMRSPIYVAPGQWLVARWSALTNNDLVSLASQIRVHKLEYGLGDRITSSHLNVNPDGNVQQDQAGHAVPVVVGDQVAAV